MTIDPSIALSIVITVCGVAVNYGVIVSKLTALKEHDDQSDVDAKELHKRLRDIELALIELRVLLTGTTGQNGVVGTIKELKAEIIALRDRQ